MIINSYNAELEVVLQTAKRMCAAARTAPKARGVDNIVTLILTDSDKDNLAAKMEEIVEREQNDRLKFLLRDAGNVRNSAAVVLIGAKNAYAGLPFCSYCGYDKCASCEENGGRCAFNMMDLGIAVGSAVSVAADDRVDNRILYTAGKAACEMDYLEGNIIWLAIPLSIKGKNIFFDRK
ncbi:MAG: hypothetical protein GX633_06690 [Clostridiales bacterium]|nr:hypothetical protein [Clostridiales bacterium]